MIGSHASPTAFELIVLDPAGRIRFSDAQASAWLTDGDIICRDGKTVVGTNREGKEALQRLISSCLADAANACQCSRGSLRYLDAGACP